jgi:hypothetical protein
VPVDLVHARTAFLEGPRRLQAAEGEAVKTVRLFIGGVLLTLIGVYLLYAQLLWFAMVQHSCDKHWDLDGCQSLIKVTYAYIMAPAPGLAMLAVAIYRFVRWLVRAGPAPRPAGGWRR